MIDLPPCAEVQTALHSEFRAWDAIGHVRNQGVEVYIFKMPDKGEDATYVRFMFTPSRADIEYGLKIGWRYMPDLSCMQAGVMNNVIMLTTKAKERV